MRITHALPLILPLLGGCYTYTPVSLAAIPQGSSVRAHLTRSGTEALAGVPAMDGLAIEGTFRGLDPDVVHLQVSASEARAGFRGRELSQGIAISRSDVVAVELRRLDRARTAGLAAIAAAGVVALAVKILSGETRLADREPPPDGGVEIRVPIGFGFVPF